ncbi:hypothetical protein FZ025_20300 [Xanthomonas hyacinthi]|uniref:hypothetical protein n=1 Tax=Xanthomonas hyacinthi TaxID=56455 RepID=UPI0011B0A95E|nr:hypothetical protein [Xanthomonas hyacinthi]QGY78855.1 hypothetical protein FZ025_20300 [Xanthomonas hyacinthi]
MRHLNGNQYELNEKWRSVSGAFKLSLYLSAMGVLTSDLIARYVMDDNLFGFRDHGVARAWIYIFEMYVLALPIICVVIFRRLSGYKYPKHTIVSRIILTIFSFVFCPLLALAPVLLLILGDSAVGQSLAAYRAFSGSALGLFIGGAFFVYVAAIMAWALLVCLPNIWIQSTKDI